MTTALPCIPWFMLVDLGCPTGLFAASAGTKTMLWLFSLDWTICLCSANSSMSLLV